MNKKLIITASLLGLVSGTVSIFISGLAAFIMFFAVMLGFCLAFLIFKISYLYVLTLFLLLIQLTDMLTFYLFGRTSTVDIVLSISVIMTLICFLYILIITVIRLFKKMDIKKQITFIVVNLLFTIIIIFSQAAFNVLRDLGTSVGLIQKTDLYFVWLYIAYQIPSVIVLLSKDRISVSVLKIVS